MTKTQKIILDHILQLADATGIFTTFDTKADGTLHLLSEKEIELPSPDYGERYEYEIGFNKDGSLFGHLLVNGYYREFTNLEELIQWIGIAPVIPNVIKNEPIFFHKKNLLYNT